MQGVGPEHTPPSIAPQQRRVMGNQSSQLEGNGEMPQNGTRVIGPSMSPTPEPENKESAQVDGPAAVHDGIEQPSSSNRPSKTKMKKKPKKSLDSGAALEQPSAAGDTEAATHDTTRKSRKKMSRVTHPEPEEAAEAIVADTQPEPPTQDVEEPHPSPKQKKKRSKKNPTRDDELPLSNGTQEGRLVSGDDVHKETEIARQVGSHIANVPVNDLHEHTPGIFQSPASDKKKRNGRKKAGKASRYDADELLVSHAIGGSPPSAQLPDVHSILRYEPLGNDDEDDAAVIPSSQWQPPRRASSESFDPSQIKGEPSDGNSGLDEQLQSHHLTAIPALEFADAVADPVAEVMREHDPENNLGWLHKRENVPQQTPSTGAQDEQVDPTLPNLQPSQVKTEAELEIDSGSGSDSSTESESQSSPVSYLRSPSVQRFKRLSRSRSRSASRVPSRLGLLADQALEHSPTARPDPYQQLPYSAPSSTGSNRSIPARLPSPSSTGSKQSIAAHLVLQHSPSRESSKATRNDGPADADAMHIDQTVIQETPSPKKRAKKANLGRKKVIRPALSDAEDIVNDGTHQVDKEKGDAERTGPPTNGDAMDVDQSSLLEKIHSPRNKRTKKATPGKKKNLTQTTQPDDVQAVIDDADVEGSIVGTQSSRAKRDNRKRQGKDKLPDEKINDVAHATSNSVKGTQQSRAEAHVEVGVSDDELPLEDISGAQEVVSEALDPSVAAQDTATAPETMVENGEPVASQKRKGKRRAPQDTAPIPVPDLEVEPANEDRAANLGPAVAENATATRNNSVEPGESASQPQAILKSKNKKKRMLGQSKASLSLSQMEDDEDDEDFSTTFARRKSNKQATKSGSNEPEQGEVGGSQAPSPKKPRKPKRKRRTANNASEDEMESLLAAGPSQGRKRASNLGLSDNEDGREAKRKRLSSASKGKATGPWTQNELNDLGKVVQDFMDENGLTQHQLNQMVQEVPTKADSLNKSFWDKTEHAIPQRTRKQITERTRRIYHNFVARGTWTDEQKEEVHELFETHPKKWAEIAGMINRDQKDVRDYWRNHYLVLESQIKSRWSQDEEERLKEIMEEALSRIRIVQENSNQPRQGSPSRSIDDEAMLDWQQISAAMDLTRSRQQCRWKWVDMREKGLVWDTSIFQPTHRRSSAGPSGNMTNGISEELANAREDYRGMGPEEKFRLIDAIKDSGAREDKHIPWRALVDERFRAKWHRPTLRLVWYRLRQTVPNYEDQDVEANARHLVNYYHMHQSLPHFDDNQVDEQVEEQVIHYTRGKRIWKRPSGDLRAVRERQRRSNSVSSRASSRPRRRVSSEILNLSDEDAETGPSGSRQSAELGEERGRRAQRDGPKSDEVSVNIPGHLKGAAAKKALAQARAKAKGKRKEVARNGVRPMRSNSVAIDSDSE